MKIALGVSGGIAAYKAAELVRLLQDQGIEVQVVMTRAAREFITPLTFASLSGRRVITDLFDSAGGEAEGAIEHIALAQSIDALVVAPATADVLARMAHGLADDFLTTLFLATRAPIIIAPAMNVNMWNHPATRANLDLLAGRGAKIAEPEAGYLACGMSGEGRLAAPETIASLVLQTLRMRSDFRGETVLVTAGPTCEPIDAVRHLANRSSGRMGFALAEAARQRGAEVTLVSGPTELQPPSGISAERVRTADDMAEAVMKALPAATVIIMAAAVADYRPQSVAERKIKRRNGSLTLHLEHTRDILAEIAGRRRPGQLVVAFAAETENLIENASAKLMATGADLMVANDVTREGAGFEVDTNIVTLLFPDGRKEHLEKASKLAIAHRVLDAVAALRKAGAATGALPR